MPENTLSKRALRKLVSVVTDRALKGDETLTAAIERRRRAILELGESRDGRAWETLVAQFDDPSPSIVLAAVEAAGTSGDPRTVPGLVARLGAEDDDLRRVAVAALGEIGDRRAVRALIRFAIDDPALRYAAHGAVTSLGNVATPELVGQLASDDGAVVLESIILLGRLRDPSALRGLLDALPTGTVAQRMRTAEALGRIGDAGAVPALEELLCDPDPGTRVAAASALGRMPRSANAKPLVRALRDENDDVRRLVAEALGELGNARAGDSLSRILDDSCPRVRAAAAEALGRIGDTRATEPLLAMLDSEDVEAVTRAIGAFRNLADPRAVERLVDFLYHERSAIRQKAVESLATIGDALAAERIEGVLASDRNSDVRVAAAKALGEIRDPGSTSALETALQDEAPVRCRAIVSLGRIGDEQSLPALLAMLKDGVAEVRYQAAVAIGELGRSSAMGPLEALLDDDESLVRRGAAKALVKLGDPRGDELLELADKPQARRKSRRRAATRGGGLFDLSKLRDLSPGEMLAAFWPESTSGRAIVSGIVLVPILAFAAFTLFGTPPDRVVVRGKYVSMDIPPDGERVFIGRSTGLLEIWSTTGTLVDQRVIGDVTPVTRVLASPDGTAVIAEVGEKLLHVPIDGEVVDITVPGLTHLEASPGGEYCAVRSSTGIVRVFDTRTGTEKGAIQLRADNAKERVAAVAIDPGGKFVAVSRNRGFAVYDLASPTTPKPHDGADISAVTFSPDGSRAAGVSVEGEILVWDVGTARPAARVATTSNGTRNAGVHFSPTQPDHVLAQVGSSLVEWDTSAEAASPSRVMGTEVDIGGEFAATGDPEESAVFVWNLTTDSPPTKLDVVKHDPYRKRGGWLW